MGWKDGGASSHTRERKSTPRKKIAKVLDTLHNHGILSTHQQRNTFPMPKKRIRKPKHLRGKPSMSYDGLFALQDAKCFYCGCEMTNEGYDLKERPKGYTKDHFFPVSKGHSLDCNTVLACFECNVRKGDDMPNPGEIERFRKMWSENFRYVPPFDLGEYDYVRSVVAKFSKWFGEFHMPVVSLPGSNNPRVE